VIDPHSRVDTPRHQAHRHMTLRVGKKSTDARRGGDHCGVILAVGGESFSRRNAVGTTKRVDGMPELAWACVRRRDFIRVAPPECTRNSARASRACDRKARFTRDRVKEH
jgi:hypothetical protein